MLGFLWRQYLKEIREPALVGPGTRNSLSPRWRGFLHGCFITFRYAGFYLLFKPIAWVIVHLLLDFHTRNPENIPKTSSFIGTCNHLSNFDPLIGGLCSPRPLFSMVKVEYFTTPILGRIVTALGGFPVRRGEADRQALKTALAILKMGAVLAIYPEGTRSKSFKLQPAHAGAAMLAATSGTLVVPAGIYGTENIMRRNKLGLLQRPRVVISFGKPYDLKTEAAAFAAAHRLEARGKKGRHSDLEFLSDIMMLKIAENLPPEYQGEFTPEGVVARYHLRQLTPNGLKA